MLAKTALLLAMAAATVHIAVATQEYNEYKTGEYGGVSCPSGYSKINSESDCAAAVYMGGLYSAPAAQSLEAAGYVIVSSSDIPPGCVDRYGTPKWNTHQTGSAHDEHALICVIINPTTNPTPGPTSGPTPGPTPGPTGECDSKLFQQYTETGFKVASKNDAFESITKIKKAFKAIKESYRAAKTNLRKLGREAKE